MLREESTTIEPCVWNPTITSGNVDKTRTYIISAEDVNIDLTCFTTFADGGLNVIISGARLYHLLRAGKIGESDDVIDSAKIARRPIKNKKNVCFDSVGGSGIKNIIKKLHHLLKMPPCIVKILKDIEIRPRHGRFRKRFIINCYVANVLTCTKCNKQCIINMMANIYRHDEKCIKEFENILYKNEVIYKPPNCNKMLQEKLCLKSMSCKGANPICNF